MRFSTERLARNIHTAAFVAFALPACGAPEAQLAEDSHDDVAALGLTVADADFLEGVAMAAAGQMEYGAMVAERSRSFAVREYAEYLTGYVQNLLHRAKAIGEAGRVFIPVHVSARDEYHLLRLGLLHGVTFDNKYISYEAKGINRSFYDTRWAGQRVYSVEARALARDILDDLRKIGDLLNFVNGVRVTSADEEGVVAKWRESHPLPDGAERAPTHRVDGSADWADMLGPEANDVPPIKGSLAGT